MSNLLSNFGRGGDTPPDQPPTEVVPVSDDGNTWYAWSQITKEADPSGRPAHVYKPGEVVRKSDIHEHDWEYFVTSGVVRTVPYPDLTNFDGSPNDFYKQKLAAVSSLDSVVNVSQRDVESLRSAGLIPPGAEIPED